MVNYKEGVKLIRELSFPNWTNWRWWIIKKEWNLLESYHFQI